MVGKGVSYTLSTSQDQTMFVMSPQPIVLASGQANAERGDGYCPALAARGYKDPPILFDEKEPYSYNLHAVSIEQGISGTLQTKVNSLNSTNPVLHEATSDDCAVTIHDGTRWVVRRLTPTECERLQGFPDGWTDIGEWVDSKGKVRKTADGARYKALGNSFAVPCVRWIGERIQQVVERGRNGASSLL